jgi:hypothetical protein
LRRCGVSETNAQIVARLPHTIYAWYVRGGELREIRSVTRKGGTQVAVVLPGRTDVWVIGDLDQGGRGWVRF